MRRLFTSLRVSLVLASGNATGSQEFTIAGRYPECGSPSAHSDFYLTDDTRTKARVVRVIDGETLHVVLRNGRGLTVRLAGVKAPDLDTDAGQVASRFLHELALNAEVDLLRYGYDLDEYERLQELESLISNSATRLDLGLTMLEAGMASYRRSRHLGSYDQCRYEQAHLESRREMRGLWGAHAR